MNHMTIMPDPSAVTFHEIAKLAGVSEGTVSRALRERKGVSAETREKILAISRELNYDLSKLKKRRVRRVAFLLRYPHDITGSNTFYSRVLLGAEDACRRHGLSMAFVAVGPKDSVVDLMRANTCDAAICAGFFEPEVIKAIHDSGQPLVLIDMKVRGFASVNPDNVGGAYQAIQHLLGIGRTRIGMISGHLSHCSTRDRIRGYRLALFDSGILADPSYEVSISDRVDLDDAAGTAMQTLLGHPNPPDAVFCYNDAAALAAMRACLAAGLKVPHDISIVGFDDIPAAMLGHRALTTLRVNKEELGATGVEFLLREDKTQAIEKTIPVQLVIRASTVLDRWTTSR